MTSLALLLIGFSLFSALSLALTHFRSDQYREHTLSRRMGLVLLIALCTLQIVHFAWLYLDLPWVEMLPYRMALFAVAPAFFLFSQPLLKPGAVTYWRPVLLVHALPLGVAPDQRDGACQMGR